MTADKTAILQKGTKGRNGWFAELDLELDVRAGKTALVRKRQVGPLTVQRAFYPEGNVCHLYLLHPPAGLVGGDRIDIELSLASGASALITTPGAAKLYRSAHATAVVKQRLKVGSGGLLEWFPQESILFPGAQARSETRVDLAGDAGFMGWEISCLGRPVIEERFDTGVADLIYRLCRDGRPLLEDRLRVGDGRGLEGPSRLRGFPVLGTFVATPAGTRDLDSAREALTACADFPLGFTLIEDLLVARCLAPLVEPANRIFRSLWGILRPRMLGRDACLPRIWST